MRKRHLSAVRDVLPPYAFSAGMYSDHGWSPLPLPPGKKTYPPVGYTGQKGRRAEPEKINYWIRTKPNGNVALRMTPDLIGIDVDDYEGKDGAETIRRAEAEWGPLPPTWITTSRDRTNSVAGIRLYRIPEGLAWPGKLPQGGGVELCRWDHRYVIVAPSIHDETGAQYHWYSPDGEKTTDLAAEGGDCEFPAPHELPDLPEAWVKGLTAGKTWVEREEEDLDPEEVSAWIVERPGGALCEKMQRTLDTWMAKVSAAGEDGGAHDAARDAAWSVLRDSAAGHSGVQKALEKIRLAHAEALRKRRPEKAAGEWASIKARGVRKVAAEGPTDEDDPCEMGEVSRAPRVRNRGSEGMDFERDDIGNGQRFALQWRDEVRWVPAHDAWFIWRDNVWEQDSDHEIDRMATKVVRGMTSEAAFIEDSKEKAAFLKFVRASSNKGKLEAMLDMAKTNKGVTVPAETFNANRSHLVCPNGTLVLPIEFSGEKIKKIRSVQEHYNTIHTGTEYHPDARLPEWDKFITRFQPDAEVRDWLQKLAGYSLLGRNPRRLMPVAIGDTSTGKSTFAEAVASALGPYAGSANMTIFRDNQDDKARPDLLRVLPMRFVYAEEASRSWHLHPDQIKRITGGTPLTARGMRSNVYVDQVPAFTPWLVTNHAPTIEGADAALWRRIVVVPFDVQIPKTEEDARFRDRLTSPEGRQAILAWLVAGYQAYLADPDSVQEIPAGAMIANSKFRAEVSDLATFLSDVCEIGSKEDPEYRVGPEELYRTYQAWCESNGVHAKDTMSGTKFGKEVSGEFPKVKVKVDGKGYWFRKGIRVRPDWNRMTV